MNLERLLCPQRLASWLLAVMLSIVLTIAVHPVFIGWTCVLILMRADALLDSDRPEP